jgi:ribosomal protein S18 acetylase RimI-like enzyme
MNCAVIREATPDDLPAVAALWQGLAQTHERPPFARTAGDAEREQWLASFRAHLGRFAFLWVIDASPLLQGFLLARLKPRPDYLGGELVGEVSAIHVEPAYRGTPQAWAKQLVEAACARLAKAGALVVEVNIDATNLRSAALFEALGFEVSTRTLVRMIEPGAGG